MNRRGLTWRAAGMVGLVLIVLGAHLAWEQRRYRLETPKGTLWIGMTEEQVAEVLGEVWMADDRRTSLHSSIWILGSFRVLASFYEGKLYHVTAGTSRYDKRSAPRPCLFAHVRSWFTGKAE